MKIFELIENLKARAKTPVDAEKTCDTLKIGYNKAVLVLGHIGSERQGMKLLAKMLQKEFSEFKTHYIECGEVYARTDR